MRQSDQIFGDSDESEMLSPQQIVDRWKPVLESLDRLFGDDPQQEAIATGKNLLDPIRRAVE